MRHHIRRIVVKCHTLEDFFRFLCYTHVPNERRRILVDKSGILILIS